MNLYEVLIQREELTRSYSAETIVSPSVTQLVLAEFASVSERGGLMLGNVTATDPQEGIPNAAFAPGEWVSFHIVTHDAPADDVAILSGDRSVWS